MLKLLSFQDIFKLEPYLCRQVLHDEAAAPYAAPGDVADGHGEVSRVAVVNVVAQLLS